MVEEEVNLLLCALGLEKLKERKINELSGGQKQRVAIARALIKKPKIILADEPTGNLDSATGKDTMNLLKEISKEKLVIVVSHDNETARTYADRIIEINDGTVINNVTNKILLDETNSKYEIIKSTLPTKESFSLGLGSLKHKKIKLMITIFLTVCALLFLSLSDTLASYNIEKAHSKLLEEKGEEFVQINKYKYYNMDGYSYTRKKQIKLNEKDISLVKDKVDKEIYDIYKMKKTHSYSNIYDILKINYTDKRSGSAYNIPITNADIIEVELIDEIVNQSIIGRTPSNNDEIVMSNYIADMIIEFGIKTYDIKINEFMDNSLYKPKNYNELLQDNKVFYFGDKGKVKIVGIIDYDIEKYKSLKNKDTLKIDDNERKLYEELIQKAENIYSKIYVNTSFVESLNIEESDKLDMEYIYRLESKSLEDDDSGYYIATGILNKEIEYYDGFSWVKTNKLNEYETILDINELTKLNYNDYETKLNAYIEKNEGEDKNSLQKKFFENYVKEYNIIGEDLTVKVYDGRDYNSDTPENECKNIKVIGLTGYDYFEASHLNYFSEELLGNYKIDVISQTGYLIPIETENEVYQLLNEFNYNDTLSVHSTYSASLYSLIETTNMLSSIGFYINIILLLFTVFLIGNFVISSINYRKKVIGILKSLGGTNFDIMKIFIWEGLIMSLISALITSILLIITTTFLNNIIMSETSLILTPFIIGIRQFVIIALVVFIVTIISSIFPIIKISKMNPIDAILNK